MPPVPMLLYHKVDEIPPGVRHPEIYVAPTRFAEQLALLRRLGRHGITLADYVAYRRGERALPPRPVVLTFDDGYRSNYEVAFPILQAFGFPATIFLVSSLFGGRNVWDPDEPQEPLLERCHVWEMQCAGIDFQSHTRTHVRLTAVPSPEALCELRTSRCELEQALGAPVCGVAYPWGAHDDTVLALAAEAGYEAGCIVRRRTNFDHTPLLALRRIGVRSFTSRRELAWDLLRLRWRGD